MLKGVSMLRIFLALALLTPACASRACVALSQFGDDYPSEAGGRLKTQYEATRAGVKCN